MTPPPERADLRWQVYGLLITLAVGLGLGRLVSAERVNEPSVHRADDDSVTPRPAWPKSRPDPWPTFGSNDRSRWATVRALVEEGTWVIGRRDPGTGADSGIVFESGFQTVDKVLHPERFEFYSTKPPLLTLLAAGEYWVLKHGLGWDIVEDRWLVVGTVVATFNLVPLVFYLLVLAWLAERLGEDDWGRLYVVAAGGFATLVSPFLISFNNHTVATASAAVAVYATMKIREGGKAGWFLLAGLSAGFTACNELPATALAAGLAVYLLARDPARALTLFLPAALLPVAAMLAANYAQLGQLKPAYAEFGGPWYQYEGSHWQKPKRGIDYAAYDLPDRPGERKPAYAFHLLLGHHGWFSLTPIMFLSLAGMLAWAARWRPGPSPPESSAGPLLAVFTLLVSAVVIGFYVYKSDNYGGWSNGPRWLMWLTPLWLVCLLPALGRLGRSRAGRLFALALLALSVMSMHYQSWNPWRHPWIYNWMDARGMIPY